MMLRDYCSFITIRGAEFDGNWNGKWHSNGASNPNDSVGAGIGISSSNGTATNMTQDTHLVEYCWLHDLDGEGLYLGTNWKDDGFEYGNCTTRFNIIERCGRDCINLKRLTFGTNNVYGNHCTYSGLRQLGDNDGTVTEYNGQQGENISFFECAANINVYNNFFGYAAGSVIHFYNMNMPDIFPRGTLRVYNNIAYDGVLSTIYYGGGWANKGALIQLSNKSGAQIMNAEVYQNTCVKSRYQGIHLGGAGTKTARDNIICDVVQYESGGTQTNNLKTPSSSAGFVNAAALNFRLTSGSPARNSTAQGPSFDYDNNSRPMGASYDRGAFEFVE
jgi:hypothetical protein